MITTTVMVTIPPIFSEIPIPIAVVMDFGRSVTYCSWFRPSIRLKAKTLTMAVSTPAMIPPKIAFG